MNGDRSADSGYVYLVTSQTLGPDSPELGLKLMESFLYTLLEARPIPVAIILLNGGVMLATGGSGATDTLIALADRGVDVLSCGTCLDYYGRKDSLAAGRVSTMDEISGLLRRYRTISV